MKKLLLILILLSNVLIAIAQSNWVTTKVGNELSVKFPNNPNSDTKPDKRLTMFTTIKGNGNCYFTVVVRKQALNDYDRIKKLSLTEQENEINSFLDKGISQFIEDGDIITPLKAIKIGNYIGKELTYTIKENNGKQATVFAKFIFANNNLYIVSCSIYQQGLYESDKNLFLNSITVRTQTQNTSAIPPLANGTSKSTVKSSSTSKGTNDNSAASQYDTEQWILSKLRSYAPKSYDVPIKDEFRSYGVAWIVKDINFSFDTYNLVINYSQTQPNRFGFNNQEESKTFYKVTIPIYAIQYLYNSDNEKLAFSTAGSVITEENTSKSEKSVTSYISVPFNASSETDLVKRLEKAFFHLKKFYVKPENKELF